MTALGVQSMPGEILSPSQASTFLGCSAKYRFKYVLDLPDPPQAALSAGGPSTRRSSITCAPRSPA
jgi:hypothetical protein